MSVLTDKFPSLCEDHYAVVRDGAGLCDRSSRGLLEITGADRAAWLHNLTTHQIKTLEPGEGRYTFALNVKGRILFDMNVLVRGDSFWLDIDRRWIDFAKAHFAKYIIMEDVTVTDLTEAHTRIALVGAGTGDALKALGSPRAAVVPYNQIVQVAVGDVEVSGFRHDLVGVFAMDLVVPLASADAVVETLAGIDGVRLVSTAAVDTVRIESGIPWPVSEINDGVLPAETGQIGRAVSFNKGCYLGQEIVERMRSRDSVSRKLVLIKFDSESVPAIDAKLIFDGKSVGAITSACRSSGGHAPIALGYVRLAQSSPETPLTAEWEGGSAGGIVMPIATSH